MQNHEFTLADADGVEHAYIMSYHGATEGAVIAFALLAGGSGSIGLIVSELTKGGQIGELLQGNGLDGDVSELLQAIDFQRLGDEVAKFLRGADAIDLVSRILSKTIRDGKPLSSRQHFDMAYMANYAELYRAAFEVVKQNRFFPLSAGF